ncbi:MAG TPA: glycosyltransferase family 39 protein, partial [Candidatus Saccharimonadales bacterium]|nr:glycosyltransferase family 39 protein [Candidatus Saccharimonadales bacterium]
VAVFFLLLGHFRGPFVWPLGLLAAALICIPITRVLRAEGSDRPERKLCNVLAIAGVSAWVLFNMFFAAQHFLTNRDPGVYTVAGARLTSHDDLRPPASDVFGADPAIAGYSGGFSTDVRDDSKLNAQGQHLLPALLGLSGKVIGVEGMGRINVLLGGIALLAVYGFARQLVRPRWALVAAGALALSLPMLYFSRDTYTEPLAAAFTFGALTLVWLAQKNKGLGLWLAAGIVAAAGALTRIDAYLTLAGLAAFLAVMLALSHAPDRKRNLAAMASFVLGAGVIGALGFVDVARLSGDYYTSQAENIKPEFMLLAFLAVAGTVLVALAWRTGLLRWLDGKTRGWRAQAVWAAVVAIALALASRPLWYTGHGIGGVTVGGETGRNFSEQTVNWLVWYLGPVMAALGAFGLAYAAGRASKAKNLLLLPAVFVIGGTALFYLIRPSIFPDQPWGSRRLLPVILPGVAVFGALALEWLYARRHLGRNVRGKAVITALVALILIGPLFISLPFLRVRENTWYAPVKAVCKEAPEKSAILWVGTARARFVEPTKTLCGIPSEGYGTKVFNLDVINNQKLAAASQAARANGFEPVVGVYKQDIRLIDTTASLTSAITFSYQQIESTYTTPPRVAQTRTDTILLGIINPDGTISGLPNRDNP